MRPPTWGFPMTREADVKARAVLQRAAGAAIRFVQLTLFGFVVVFCGNEIQYAWSSGYLSDSSPIALSDERDGFAVSGEIETKFGPPLLFESVIIANLPENIEPPATFLSFEYLDPFGLRKFSLRHDVPAWGWDDAWIERKAAWSWWWRQLRDDEIIRQRMCQKVNHAAMFDAISWREPIVRFGKTENRRVIGGNIIEHGGVDGYIRPQLPRSRFLQMVQLAFAGFPQPVSGISQVGRGRVQTASVAGEQKGEDHQKPIGWLKKFAPFGIVISFPALWFGCNRSDRFAVWAVPVFTLGWLVAIIWMGMA